MPRSEYDLYPITPSPTEYEPIPRYSPVYLPPNLPGVALPQGLSQTLLEPTFSSGITRGEITGIAPIQTFIPDVTISPLLGVVSGKQILSEQSREAQVFESVDLSGLAIRFRDVAFALGPGYLIPYVGWGYDGRLSPEENLEDALGAGISRERLISGLEAAIAAYRRAGGSIALPGSGF